MTNSIDPIRVEGLREFQRALKEMDGESQKKLRLVLNDAAELVVDRARRNVPVKTGGARKSIRVSSSQREARVKAGGARVPYYGFLDYGGKTGRWPNGTHRRPFERDGRYLYPAYYAERRSILERLERGLTDLARDSGLDVS